jgi:hypothetical protein
MPKALTTRNPEMVFLQQVPRHLGDRVLDLLHVARDVAHEGAGAVAREEGERLVQDVAVELVAEVGHRALPGLGHQRRGEEGAEALERVEAEDRDRGDGHRTHVHVLHQHVVEDGLDHVGEQGPGRGVTRRGQPRAEQQQTIGSGVAEEPPELAHVLTGTVQRCREAP